jgi:hypothetical protein
MEVKEKKARGEVARDEFAKSPRAFLVQRIRRMRLSKM